MLYDPKWEVKIDPLSLESLVAWLEKQPAETIYDHMDPSACLLGQWLTAMGVEPRRVGTESCKYGDIEPFGHISIFEGPWTFGAALERARAANSAL